MVRPSSTPKTRASTSAGAVRCSSVLPATSNRLRAAPATASSRRAPTGADQAVITANEAPQSASDASTAGISRALPTSDAVTPIPSAPPAPKAAFR